MVRPRRPAQYRNLEAGDAAAILQRNTVPLRLAGWLSRAQPVREIRLHLEEPTLSRQPRPFLRVCIWTPSLESKGRSS